METAITIFLIARQKLLVEFRQTMTNDECVSSKKLNKKWKYQNKYQIR